MKTKTNNRGGNILLWKWNLYPALTLTASSCCIIKGYLYRGVGGVRCESDIYMCLPEYKIGCIRCKISLKKRGHSVWAQKKKKNGCFLHGFKKIEVIQCRKIQLFSCKNLRLFAKITWKMINLSKCAPKCVKFCDFCLQFSTNWKKRGHWVWTGSWYPPTYGSAPLNLDTNLPTNKCIWPSVDSAMLWCPSASFNQSNQLIAIDCLCYSTHMPNFWFQYCD